MSKWDKIHLETELFTYIEAEDHERPSDGSTLSGTRR